MKYKVPDEIVEQTKKCKKDYECLSGSVDLCPINLPKDTSVYVKCKNNQQPCDYCISVGSIECMCTCPTRLELYKRYGV